MKIIGTKENLKGVWEGGGEFWQPDLKYAFDKHVEALLNYAAVMLIHVAKPHLLLP